MATITITIQDLPNHEVSMSMHAHTDLETNTNQEDPKNIVVQMLGKLIIETVHAAMESALAKNRVTTKDGHIVDFLNTAQS